MAGRRTAAEERLRRWAPETTSVDPASTHTAEPQSGKQAAEQTRAQTAEQPTEPAAP